MAKDAVRTFPAGTSSMLRYCLLSMGLLTLLAAVGFAADPPVSGLKPGQRPGPYSSLVAVGADRGKSHCFICETEDRPAVIVFARKLDDGLGKLVRQLDQAKETYKKEDLRAWVTMLHEDETAFNPQVVEWAKQQSIRRVPMSIFEDREGPPAYRLSRDAEVTVLLSVKQKVVRNFAFRSGELTEARVAEIAKAVEAMVGKK
jgi:hypothetical protein